MLQPQTMRGFVTVCTACVQLRLHWEAAAKQQAEHTPPAVGTMDANQQMPGEYHSVASPSSMFAQQTRYVEFTAGNRSKHAFPRQSTPQLDLADGMRYS